MAFVSHQANRRIIQAATEKLGVDPGKAIIGPSSGSIISPAARPARAPPPLASVPDAASLSSLSFGPAYMQRGQT
jgi:hypothetical protein